MSATKSFRLRICRLTDDVDYEHCEEEESEEKEGKVRRTEGDEERSNSGEEEKSDNVLSLSIGVVVDGVAVLSTKVE